MPFPARYWAAPVCMLALAAPLAGDSDAAYHAAGRVTEALKSAAADITTFEKKARDPEARPAAPAVRVAQSGEDWLEALRTGAYWKKRSDAPTSRSARRERSKREARKVARPSSSRRTTAKVALAAHTGSLPRNGGAYRTVCVRLCDGYYWPIGFASDSADLARDNAKCEQSCSMPAKLYYAPMPSEASELIDLNGQPYTRLGTAFQYRVTYNASCKCRAHPWEAEAQAMHRVYATSEPASVQEENARQAAAQLREMSAAPVPETPPED